MDCLPELPGELEELDCSHNGLVSLPTLPRQLSTLMCPFNKLETLPELRHSRLVTLYCHANNLCALPRLPETVKDIRCDPRVAEGLDVEALGDCKVHAWRLGRQL